MTENNSEAKNEGIDLESLTVKELQQEAVKLGMPEVDSKKFTIKAPLIATINALKATQVVKKVDTLTPPANPVEEKQVARKWRSKAEHMRSILDSQPKVRFFLPLEGKEKQGVVREVMIKGRKELVHVSGTIETVILNGYKTIIPKGQWVELPKQVADELANAYQMTSEAGRDLLLDRVDPNTGRTVREQLEG